MPTSHLAGLAIYPTSLTEYAGTTYFLTRGDQRKGKLLGVMGDTEGFEGTLQGESNALLCPPTAANAAALRLRLPWLRPVPLGLRTAAGFGDRLGLATPGHVQAARHRHSRYLRPAVSARERAHRPHAAAGAR